MRGRTLGSVGKVRVELRIERINRIDDVRLQAEQRAHDWSIPIWQNYLDGVCGIDINVLTGGQSLAGGITTQPAIDLGALTMFVSCRCLSGLEMSFRVCVHVFPLYGCNASIASLCDCNIPLRYRLETTSNPNGLPSGVLPSFTDSMGNCVPFWIAPESFAAELIDQVIESGSEVVDAIADRQRQIVWDVRELAEWLRIEVFVVAGNDEVFAFAGKLPDQIGRLLDIAIGPPNTTGTTNQRGMKHLASKQETPKGSEISGPREKGNRVRFRVRPRAPRAGGVWRSYL